MVLKLAELNILTMSMSYVSTLFSISMSQQCFPMHHRCRIMSNKRRIILSAIRQCRSHVRVSGNIGFFSWFPWLSAGVVEVSVSLFDLCCREKNF